MASVTKKGKFVGNPENSDIWTGYKAEGGAIEFGKGVEFGTNDDQAKTFNGNYFLGVAVEANEKIGTDDTRDYDEYDTMKIGRKGIFYVEALEDVNAGGAVGVDSGTGDFGTASTYTEIDAQWIDSGSDGDELRIDLDLSS